MSFGRPSGPPASRRQLDELLALVHRAGFEDFREARHPLGFTQRQSNGKFTRDEADEFIERLADTESDRHPDPPMKQAEPSPTGRVTAAERRVAAQTRTIAGMPSELLAAELQRRGWAVMEP